MSPEVRISILLMINLACYHFGGFWPGVFSFFITFYRILSIYGILGTPQLFQTHFKSGICYIKDYTGSYKSHQDVFEYMCKILEEKNLNDFSLIALYYDEENKEKEKEQRCSIGFYIANEEEEEYKLNEELEKYLLIEEKFRKHILVYAKSIYCKWNYFNTFTMMIGIRKFYGLMKQKLKSRNFLESYNIKKEQFNVAIEVYENFFGNKNIHFYMPFEKNDKFFLFGNDKKE
jgi:hypothetical protein